MPYRQMRGDIPMFNGTSGMSNAGLRSRLDCQTILVTPELGSGNSFAWQAAPFGATYARASQTWCVGVGRPLTEPAMLPCVQSGEASARVIWAVVPQSG